MSHKKLRSSPHSSSRSKKSPGLLCTVSILAPAAAGLALLFVMVGTGGIPGADATGFPTAMGQQCGCCCPTPQCCIPQAAPQPQQTGCPRNALFSLFHHHHHHHHRLWKREAKRAAAALSARVKLPNTEACPQSEWKTIIEESLLNNHTSNSEIGPARAASTLQRAFAKHYNGNGGGGGAKFMVICSQLSIVSQRGKDNATVNNGVEVMGGGGNKQRRLATRVASSGDAYCGLAVDSLQLWCQVAMLAA